MGLMGERDEIAADREALAEVVGGHLPQSRGAGRWPGCFSHPRVEDWTPDHLTDAVLASDWLAERDRRTAAKTLRAASKAALDDCQINAHDRTCDCATTAQWLNDRADWAEVLHQ